VAARPLRAPAPSGGMVLRVTPRAAAAEGGMTRRMPAGGAALVGPAAVACCTARPTPWPMCISLTQRPQTQLHLEPRGGAPALALVAAAPWSAAGPARQCLLLGRRYAVPSAALWRVHSGGSSESSWDYNRMGRNRPTPASAAPHVSINQSAFPSIFSFNISRFVTCPLRRLLRADD
jgi:hypothetical protein